jgi:hypothetical protein
MRGGNMTPQKSEENNAKRNEIQIWFYLEFLEKCFL